MSRATQPKLTLISADGEQSGLIAGAPEGYDDAPQRGPMRNLSRTLRHLES